ncbi:ParB/RepB/Spo0J family partition protein [Streptomyces sp. NPDC096033]|uniref:ParB/RepB/Spo0J family partition protein n=1 Tax=Streptomyces sp. NPDC096033 TaxID=3366071 RepID=UPI00381D0A92
MKPYRGTMPTAYLNDQQIRPIQFRKWRDAHRDFQARGKDRERVDALKASIAERGLLEPILLGVSDRYPDVYVGDGHHRAVALMNLGVQQFPFYWYWIRNWGRPSMESEPFPYHLLNG